MTAAITETLPGPGSSTWARAVWTHRPAAARFTLLPDGAIAALQAVGPNAGLVVCEPTGGYEAPLAQSLRSRSTWPIPTRCGPSPRPADGSKTDRIDAQALSRYGQVFASAEVSQPEQEPEREEVQALLRRRQQLWNSACRNATAWTGPGIRGSGPHRLAGSGDCRPGPGVPRGPKQRGTGPPGRAVPQRLRGTDRRHPGGGPAGTGPGRFPSDSSVGVRRALYMAGRRSGHLRQRGKEGGPGSGDAQTPDAPAAIARRSTPWTPNHAQLPSTPNP